MPTQNDSLWNGFDSEFSDRNSKANAKDYKDSSSSDWDGFWGETGNESLNETIPSSHFRSTMAENRQILNILFMIDVSGSMRGRRIAQVNYALENIFKELRRRDDPNAQIKIGIMEFAENARWVTPQPILLEDYVFTQINAVVETTNYGKAFYKLGEVLHRSRFMDLSKGEYFAPLILFVTDGEPLDVHEYPTALKQLQKNGWFQKSAKYAIAVGEEAKTERIAELLAEFTGVRENVRYADEGEALCNLIEFIAIRASEVQSSMVSRASSNISDWNHYTSSGYSSIFSSEDPSLFSSMFKP